MGVVLFFSSNSTGVAGVSVVGCGGGSCHQQDTATNINIIGLPPNGYINGQTYALQLLVSNAAKLGAGFDLMTDGGGLTAGVGTQLIGTQELYHTATNTMVGGVASWNFTWTAPTTGIAPIIFYVAGNAVNMNNNPSNDAFNTQQIMVSSGQTSSAPTVTLNNVSSITPSTATINAFVNANNSVTNCSIEYGTTLAYGNTVGALPTGFVGNADSAITATLTGLLAGTTYHYRVKATNTIGTTYSNDAQFITYPSSVQQVSTNCAMVYPNPCTSTIIYYHNHFNTNIKLQVINTLGQEQNILISPLGNGNYQLLTANLPNGFYTLVVQEPTRKQFAVFLKQ